MGWVTVGISAIAAWLFWREGATVLLWTSVATGVVAFWSWGVLHNSAMISAKEHRDLLIDNMRAEGRSEAEIQMVDSLPVRISPRDTQNTPDWPATVNMAATVFAVILLVWSVLL